MNVINLATDLAREAIRKQNQPDQILSDLIEDIGASANAASHVLNDALNLNRLQAGTFEFMHGPFSIRDALLLTVRAMKPEFQQHQLTVRSHSRNVFVSYHCRYSFFNSSLPI
jgi:signal transduction histidine kinase